MSTSYIMSPGVSVKEIDQSQYTATTSSSSNVVALVGYAERGSFDPTYVYSVEEFNETFGYTLADVPYLAQCAYKYFDNGAALLVVRAGDSRDVDAYPNAATAASKTIRVAPKSKAAIPGYQTFDKNTDLIAGTFVPSTSYTCKVLADHRAFTESKYMETWSGILDETYNETGATSPSQAMTDMVLRMAMSSSSSNSLEINFKRDLSDGTTAEFYGTGSRTGTTLGSTLQATIYKYRSNDTYEDVSTDWITLRAAYGAAVQGNKNLVAGFDWDNAAQSFLVTLGNTTYEVALKTKTASIGEVVTAITDALKKATNTTTNNETDISDSFTVEKIVPTSSEAYVALIHKSGTDTAFTLAQGSVDALSTIGWAPNTYNDSDSIYGTWNASTTISNAAKAYSGNFVFKKTAFDNAAISFQDAISIAITSPANGNWTRSAIASAIQSQLDSGYSAYNYPKSRGLVTVDATSSKIKVSTINDISSDFKSLVKISAGTSNDLASLLDGTDAAVVGVPESTIGEVEVTLTAAEKGTYGQNLYLKTETQTVKLGSTSNTYYNVYVYLNGKVVSSYYKVNWTDSTSSSYILTKMASDSYISITTNDEDGDNVLAMLPDGEWTLGDGDLPDGVTSDQAEIVSYVAGTNGWVASGDSITSMTSDFTDALDKISNPEVYEYHIVAAPGDASSGMHTAIQDLCNARRDCLGVVDAAPYGLGVGIANKTNDITEVNDACSTLTSSYVAAFWPWVLDEDSDNDQYVYLPPSIYAINAMVYTDSIADPWYAPAGLTRGAVSCTGIEYSAKETDRDILYGDTAIVNPIVKFVNEGIAIWGQKTCQRTTTATNRINVRRLLIYAEKLIAKMARSFLFEPNDSTNWSSFARQANAILEPIRQRRGLYSFTVTCDSTTNTDTLVDNNMMAGKIYLQPEKTIEGIYVDFTITSSGTTTVTES